MNAYLANPWQTAAFLGMAASGILWTPAVAAAAVFFSVCEIIAGVRRQDGPRWWPSAWPGRGTDLVILYDGTCILCARSRARLETWPTAGRMRFVTIQSDEAKTLLPDLPLETLLGQMHVIEDGRVYGGADGWYRIVRSGPIGLAMLSWVTPKWLARPAYRWIAKNRYRWFGKIDCEGGVCAIHPPKGEAGKPASPPSGSPAPSEGVPPESRSPRQT